MKMLLLDGLPAFTEILAEKMLTYALGRGVESAYDRVVVRDVARHAEDAEYRIQALIHGIVNSEPFLNRRGAEASTGTETPNR
jgi:hypothetical protein